MKIEKLSVKTGLTINLGDYESARIDVGAEAILEEGEEVRESYKTLFSICELEVADQVGKIRSDIAEKIQSAYRNNG